MFLFMDPQFSTNIGTRIIMAYIFLFALFDTDSIVLAEVDMDAGQVMEVGVIPSANSCQNSGIVVGLSESTALVRVGESKQLGKRKGANEARV